MASTTVDNNILPAYPVLRDVNATNDQIQVVRLDIGVGTAESRVSSNNALPTSSPSYALKLDDSVSPITYIGEAVTGSLGSDAVWRIKKMDETSGLVITWADGSAAFNQIWANRASLTYS